MNQFNPRSRWSSLGALLGTALVCIALARSSGSAAALLPGTGYTNAFGSQPPSADWATATFDGGATDSYDMDAEVNTAITAAGVSAQVSATGSSAPGSGSTAVWSSPGRFLQTRPTQVRYTPLMAKFVNNTGSNATELALSYTFTIADGGIIEEPNKGTRVYYSITGTANSWTNLPALNSTASANGTVTMRTNISVTVPSAGSFFLLWVDDNSSGSGSSDAANRIDDFSLRVTASLPTNFIANVQAPTNMAAFVTGTSVEATVAMLSGTAPYAVEFFTNSGSGNLEFVSAGSSTNEPYSLNLGTLPSGTYNIHAIATDSSGMPSVARTPTNTFFVADPISFSLTAPGDNATFDARIPVAGAVTVSGGTPPYIVQYYLNDVPNGEPVTTAPYDNDFGQLFVGDYAVRAAVTDALGWTSNSATHAIHITGPLGVMLFPTNGAIFNHGQPIVLEAAPGGGTSPYSVSFFTNDQFVGIVDSPPFLTNLGVLPEGIYSAYVRAADTSAQVFSTTNRFTVAPNPLAVVLTNPSNRVAVVAGSAFNLAARASVGEPVTVTNVQFFYDASRVGSDNTPPFSATVSSISAGNHSVYAMATDTLGRRAFTQTNRLTGVPPGTPVNDAFQNATIVHGSVITATGSNVGATKESGEPNHASSGGGSVWWDWTAPASGIAVVDTFGSSYDTLLAVYTGDAVNQLSSLGSNDDSQGLQSRVQFNAIAGTVYHIAVDGFGNQRGSIVLHITGPSGIAFRSPTNSTLSLAGDPVLLAVDVTAGYTGPPISRMFFYSGTNLLGSRDAEPFEMVVTNTTLGSNTFSAVAIDNTGQNWPVSPVSILVMNEGVVILSPPEGISYLSATLIRATTVTRVRNGTVTNVQFFVDGVLFDEDNTSPFSGDWTNVVSGAHRFTAIARSDAGGLFVSPPRNFSVAEVLVPYDSVWNYLDDGSNQGTNWTTVTFNDSAWASGSAPLGYGDSSGRLPATTNAFGPNPLAKYPTTYYRHAFVITNLAGYNSFTAYIERDDGAVIYVNGREVQRFNMPSGVINYRTYAFNAGDDGTFIYGVGINPSWLNEGTNIVAVEVHQDSGDSSDLWFQLRLVGFPRVIQNVPPIVSIATPTNNAYFLAPPSVAVTAAAVDPDGTVTNVQFFVDGELIAQDSVTPYTFSWTNPAVGPHSIFAVATDNLGDAQQSSPIEIVIYDPTGSPYVAVVAPEDGVTIEGGTNLLISAQARAIAGITNVQFLANDGVIGEDAVGPYSIIWDAPFGTNRLAAVAYEATGARATSAVATITVVPNTTPPAVALVVPAGNTTVTSLSSIAVTFSERVRGVNAGDLLINGVPATNLLISGGSYIFRFAQPPYGPVEVAFAQGHEITDYGYPADLPLDETAPASLWTYTLIDRSPPVIATRSPAPNSLVSAATHIHVTFNEAVTGVDAMDLYVNDEPALAVNGSGSNYTFTISQPNSGLVHVNWSPDHGITDTGVSPPNLFHGSGGDWAFLLDTRAYLVESNSSWRLWRGLAEASTPASAWREPEFDDSAWVQSLAPFVYGEPAMTNAAIPGTDLRDMANNAYNSIYLRRHFVVQNVNVVTNVWLNHRSDDGFIVWINGREALRYNVPEGDLPYNGGATTAALEATGGVPFILTPLHNAISHLANGTNTIAVHAFNVIGSPIGSDFVFNAQLYALVAAPREIAPTLVQVAPSPGEVSQLTNVTVMFSEPVFGVDASDLLVNGTPATGVTNDMNTSYTFSFAQPPVGPVVITWSASHGVVDFDAQPRTFDHSAPAASFEYLLINARAPFIAAQRPPAGSSVGNLAELSVRFSKPVIGIDAGDLLINGLPATEVEGAGDAYTFRFAQPAFGTVSITWASNSGIEDLDDPANTFDELRAVNRWSYTLAGVLRFTSVLPLANGTNTSIAFWAAANRTYSVLWKESLSAGRWTKLADIAARDADGVEVVLDPLPPAHGRIYHIVTPQQPGEINPLPAILSSPSPIIADVGDDVTFGVLAVGNGTLGYQWTFNGSPPLSAAWDVNLRTLTITNVQFADIGLYAAVVTDGGNSDTSTPAFLALRPRIVFHPAHRSVVAGEAVTFSIAAEGLGELAYAWRKNGIRLLAETNATLSLMNVQPEDAGTYSAVVMHDLPWGRLGIFSSNAVLSVTSPPPGE